MDYFTMKKCLLVSLVLSFIANHISEAQQLPETSDCDEDCNTTTCISKYIDLESYVLGNRELLGDLTEAFFRSDEGPSEFVKITYSLQILDTVDDMNNTEYDNINCTSHQRTYIWSESALYLLGPRPLVWLTLLAINIPETSVTIQLPCLCDGFVSKLLSRLTYLIKVYSATNFHDQPIEFENQYFFETKGKGSENYDIIKTIMQIIISLPITSSLMVCSIAIKFVYPKLYAYIKAANATSKKYLVSLFLTSVGINVTLFVFQVFSIIDFIQYGNEILHNSDFGNSDDHQSIPIIYAILSMVIIITIFMIAMVWSTIRLIGHNWQTAVAMTFALNFVYIGCYYLPYVILAFIHDPLQTCFIYSVEIVCCCCGYMFWFGLCSYFTSTQIWINTLLMWAAAATVIYFLFAVIFILTLGNYHDFREVQNLLLPLLIAVFSFFVSKPAYDAYAKSNFSKETEENKKQLAEEKETEIN